MGASSATAITLALGQTPPLIFLGIALFLFARITEARLLMALALALVMLKPNLGIVFVAVLVAQPVWWRSIFLGAAFSIVASLPALLPYGALEVLKEYVGQLSHYDGLAPVLPPNATGMRNLLFRVSGLSVPTTAMALVGAGLAFLVGLRGARHFRGPTNPAHATTESSLILALSCLTVSLHPYDLLVLGPLALTCLEAPVIIQVGIGVGLAIVFRANNVATLSGLTFPDEVYSKGASLASVGIVLLAVTAFARWTTAINRSGSLE